MNPSVLSQYVDELYKYGIEMRVCFDPDPNVMRIKVKKGDVWFEDSIEYTGFCREFLLFQMLTRLVNEAKNATKDSQKN